ncbi:hypothetical protein ANO14919_083760 [Xylariales sp. No.14919]|nr:hypothetical protein ANO14919_083760 [Xylariales sp. No.14919]
MPHSETACLKISPKQYQQQRISPTPFVNFITADTPAPTQARTRDIFQRLQDGDAKTLYDSYVTDDVHWTVMGTHALSGVYETKQAFLSQPTLRISVMIVPIKLNITKIIRGGAEDWAVVKMVADARLKNGKPYNNVYSWSTRWKDGKIVEVHAYSDGLIPNSA